VITFVDITTRKHAEAALLGNEKLYRSLLDTSPDAILYFSTDMHVLFCNQRAAEMYAVENPAAMLGISARDLFVSEDNPWMMAKLSKLPMNWVLRRHESGMHRKDGSAFAVEIAASLVIDEKNEVVGIISIVRDITQREIGAAA
jgi:PAS domain S-box-containing protein